MSKVNSVRLTLCLILVSAFCVTLVSLDALGKSSRTFGPSLPLSEPTPRVQVVRSSAELHALWKASGLRGRELVHASRYLHFVEPVDEAEFSRRHVFPIRTFDLVAHYERGVGPGTLLWQAVQSGISRSVHHLLPRAELDVRLAGLDAGAVGVTLEGREILTHFNGTPRRIAETLPSIAEPVLLSVDASFFDAGSVSDLIGLLRGSTLSSDLITLCRSEDNPDVSDQARHRLDEFARALAGRPQ